MKRASAFLPLAIRVLPRCMLHPAGRMSNSRNPSLASSSPSTFEPPNPPYEPPREFTPSLLRLPNNSLEPLPLRYGTLRSRSGDLQPTRPAGRLASARD